MAVLQMYYYYDVDSGGSSCWEWGWYRLWRAIPEPLLSSDPSCRLAACYLVECVHERRWLGSPACTCLLLLALLLLLLCYCSGYPSCCSCGSKTDAALTTYGTTVRMHTYSACLPSTVRSLLHRFSTTVRTIRSQDLVRIFQQTELRQMILQ